MWPFSFHQLPKWLNGKESAHQCRRHRFYPWVRKIPWRRKWQSTPVFLPGKSHPQGRLEGSSMRQQRAGQDWACTNAHSVIAVQLVEETELSPWCMLASSLVIDWLVTPVWVYCWGLYSDLFDSLVSFCVSTMQFWSSCLGVESTVWSLGSSRLQLCCYCRFPRIALTILGLL